MNAVGMILFGSGNQVLLCVCDMSLVYTYHVSDVLVMAYLMVL